VNKYSLKKVCKYIYAAAFFRKIAVGEVVINKIPVEKGAVLTKRVVWLIGNVEI